METGIMPGDTLKMSLSDVYPMLVAYMALYTGAMLVGTDFGFVLLDEKDQNTLKAMLVVACFTGRDCAGIGPDWLVCLALQQGSVSVESEVRRTGVNL